MTRFQTLIIAYATAFLGMNSISSYAQWKPEKNIEIVIGLTPGSFQDHTGRMIQKIMQEQKLLNVVTNVVNKAGAGGVVAWAYMGTRANDPHYLLVASTSVLTSHILGVSLHAYTDFTPIASLSAQYIALAVSAGSSIKSGRDLMERLKKDINSVAFANNGRGNNLHIMIAVVAKAAGVDVRKLKIAFFQGGGELTTAVLGGHVDVIATATSNILPHLQSGKMRIIGIASPKRMTGTLADVPTWKEQGVDTIVQNWSGIFGPKGLTPAQVTAWEDVFGKVVKTSEWKTGLENNHQVDTYLPSRETAALLREQYGLLRASLVDLGVAK